MKRTHADWLVIKKIREAMITKSILLRQSLPRPARSALGKHMIIPDDLRSYEDIVEDKEYRRLRDDNDNIAEVFEKWLPILDPMTRAVVQMKSVPGTYWGDVSKELVRLQIARRAYTDRYLLNIFNDGIREISKRFVVDIPIV